MRCAVENPVEVLKEGTVWIATTTQLHRSKMSERWLTLARECPPTINGIDLSENNVFLQTCKSTNGVQRKVQEFDLSDFEMVTSAYSSSSGTLGPNRSVVFRFTVHCSSDSHDFCTKDEHTMLSWVAAVKQALCLPNEDKPGEIFAVTYKREDRPRRAATMTPSVWRQTPALLCVQQHQISLLHPLTEEALEEWPADSVTRLLVNSAAHSLLLYVCDGCQPRDGGVVSVTCPPSAAAAQRLASSLISSLPLQSCVRRGDRELSCEILHTCEAKVPSRPESRSSSVLSNYKAGSGWCGSCGNLCDGSAMSPQAVGQLMKTSACKQLSSMYSAEQGVPRSRSFHERSRSAQGADPEGYMIMKSEEPTEKVDRCGTLPTQGSAPAVSEHFRRTKSATFNTHARLSRMSGHLGVQAARSLTSTPDCAKRASTEGEPTYVEPVQVTRRLSHLPDSIPQLKPSASRTTSDQSCTSANPSDYYASSVVLSQHNSVNNPPSTDSGNSDNSYGSPSTPCSSSLAADNSETDEDGYSFMSFPEPAKPLLRPSASSRPNRSLNTVDESATLVKAAQRTRSSPSMLAHATLQRVGGAPPHRTRTASPSFSELEKRASSASAKVRQRRDEERGYVTPEPVAYQRRRMKPTASTASLPLSLSPDNGGARRPEVSYMALLNNGTTQARKSESVSYLPASGSPDSGIGQEPFGMGDAEGKHTSKAAIIKKRVTQKKMLQRSRHDDDYEEPTHVPVHPMSGLPGPPLPPKPADLPRIENPASPVPPLPPKPVAQ